MIYSQYFGNNQKEGLILRILFISHEKNLNGSSKSLLNIIEMLEQEHTIYVLTRFSDGAVYDELSRHNVTILVYKYFLARKSRNTTSEWILKRLKYNFYSKFENQKTAKTVAKIVKDKKIDIIHSNTSVIDIGGLISQYTGVPHIWHLREFGDLDFSMYPATFNLNYKKWMNSHAERFVCISQAIYNHYDYLDEKKRILVYNGVDKRNILERNYIRQNNIIKFLIAGRILETKGQYEAIAACELLLQQGVKNFELHIAGSGKLNKEYSSEIMKHIVIHGFVKDMPSLRKNMDVELVCSNAEAFGRVTAEAMLGGMPVIGSNTGGTVELIKHEKTGYLYSKGNIKELAGYMKEFICNTTQIEKMGNCAKEYALEHFTIEHCVTQLLNLYQEELNKKNEYSKDKS